MQGTGLMARMFFLFLTIPLTMMAVGLWQLVYLGVILKEPWAAALLAPLATFETCGILLLGTWIFEDLPKRG